MRVLSSESALRFLEEDVVSVEKELAEVEIEIQKQPNLEAEFEVVLMYAKYILEHLSEMLLDLSNPIKKATYFGALFNKMPTYPQIDLRTTKNSPPPEVNELFKLKTAFQSTYGDLTENRTPIARMRTWCPNR